jgi:hypothetical protein
MHKVNWSRPQFKLQGKKSESVRPPPWETVRPDRADKWLAAVEANKATNKKKQSIRPVSTA